MFDNFKVLSKINLSVGSTLTQSTVRIMCPLRY